MNKGGYIMIIYQLCPKCNGQGTVSKPPWVDGDVNEWIGSATGGYICDVCNGAKIIPTPEFNSYYEEDERSDYPCDATESMPKEVEND